MTLWVLFLCFAILWYDGGIMKIGIFDSGRGGTTVMAAIKELLPEEEYFYIADTENCPYGDKADDELYGIVRGNVDRLAKWGAEVIVVACNTATTRCIEKLRGDYPDLKFVGTEPAVKLAVDTGAKKILVLATPGTAQSERLASLVKENLQPGQEIEVLACPGLADTIEHNLDGDLSAVEAKLDELLPVDTEPDVVVLGCTHYSLVKEMIQRHFPGARVVDGNAGVAKRVKGLAK